MWFLFFVLISAAAGAPFSPPWGTTASGSGNAGAVVLQSAAAENITGEAGGPGGPGEASLTDAQNRSVPTAGSSGFDVGRNDSAETLEELENSAGLLEGDILVPEDRNAVQTLWQDAVVFYSIGHDLAHRRNDILAAFNMISNVTCIRFTRRSNQLNYVDIRNGKGCASLVGCRGGVQPVYFGPPCMAGNLAHELIHALGLYHEHARVDRDRYVTINWSSIEPGKQRNFKVMHGDTLNLPYDLGSIMHYGPYFFSADGNPTMSARQSGVQLGQRKRLSSLDIQKLNRLYRCDQRLKSWSG